MAFKLDYSSLSSDENLNRFRRSNQIGMKNLNVTDELSVGDIKVKDNHMTIKNTKDPVIYLDSQINILQSAYSDDVDVIDTDKNTSFIDYRNLSKTYYSKISGSGDEDLYRSNKCVDINNNLYIVLRSRSYELNIYDSTNNNVPVGDVIKPDDDGSTRDIVIVKYNHLGVYQWSTYISGDSGLNEPTLVCDIDGNIVVCFSNQNSGEDVIKIYDTENNNYGEPAFTVTDTANDSSVIVKYNSNGVFLWTVHVDGVYEESGNTVTPKISCDTNGNVFLAHSLQATKVKIYDRTPEDYFQLPTDFFIINHDNELQIYTQPIFTYDTGINNRYNYVTMKFDKNGMFKWINHIEMTTDTDYSQECYIDNDIDGNIILTGNFRDVLKAFNPLNTTSTPDAKLIAEVRSAGYDNIFLIKYNKDGNVIWSTQVATQNLFYEQNNNSSVSYPNTITDSDNNIYLNFTTFTLSYLYDTDDNTSFKHEVVMKTGTDNSLMIVKYNKNGVISWYTIVDGFQDKYDSCVAIENRFVKGTENSNLYLAGTFNNNLNFYNSTDVTHVAYTLSYDDANGSNVFISCFDQDGMFSWATKAATAVNNFGSANDITISADKDGYVYLIGEYNMLLNIYDVQSNNKPVATLTKSNEDNEDEDIFIIKYNRYGLLNTSDPKLLYIEDNSDLPDSFCKQIILTNNDNNGIVNLQILKKENYGYSVRRNVLITESIELITKDGLWIPKIIADQYEHVNDLDVIDTSTKTSFVNYENLQNTFYTRIGGDGDTLNPQIHLDKNDNIYMVGVFTSNELNIYDFTNTTVPVGSIIKDDDGSNKCLFLTKYDSKGVNQWYTKIGGDYQKSEPSVFVNANGDLFVSLQSYDEDGLIKIYDVTNKQVPVKTLVGFDPNSGNASTIFVKYNNKGEFLWNIRMISTNAPPVENSFTSTAVVTGDLEGNLFVSGFFGGDSIYVIDTGNDDLTEPVKILSKIDEGASGAYFICKFDYTGKFLWINHIEGGLIPNNDFFGQSSTDLFKYININLNADSYGNICLTSSFYDNVLIYNPDNTTVQETISFNNESNIGLGIFTIKYNGSGKYQWYNFIVNNTGIDSGDLGLIQSGSCVDADGNLYISFTNVNYINNNYAVFDTRKISQPVYEYADNDIFLISIIKFNHSGIFQWNNFVKVNNYNEEETYNLLLNPVITCDNQYITGQYNPNIYVHLNGIVDNYRGGFNFYNASSNNIISYTLPSKEYWTENSDTMHSILSKFDANGNFQWATTTAGNSDFEFFGNMTSCVKTDSLGHVYISGTYIDDLSIWDVSTNSPDDNEIAQLNEIGGIDCYLIKYNKYGLINDNTHRNIYIEDVSNLPDAFEKSIVITNNTNNGPVNCQILEPLSSGFGFNIRKNITLTDSLDLISNNGIWIPKVQAEQISMSSDFDVIDVNTKLSVLDYNDLNQSSWATRISGSENETNIRLSSDKDNNVYAICNFDSSTVQIGTLDDDNFSLNRYSGTGGRDIALVKYMQNGRIDWVTHIGFESSFTGYPSFYTDADGNSYISVVENNGVSNNIYIFDIRNQNTPLTSTTLTSNGACLIKYDKKGIYLWHVHISAINSGSIYGICVVADKKGNVYLSGFINNGIEISDTSDNVKATITNNGMFVVKFDKTGKYIWSIPLYNGINTEDNNTLSCDQDGNVIISAIQNGTVTVYSRLDGAVDGSDGLNEDSVREHSQISKITDSSVSLFTVKYDTNGKFVWSNRLGSNGSGEDSGVMSEPVSTIDSYGNYYLAARISGGNAYIYDTRNADVVKYSIPIPTNGTYNTIFAKYNKNGIIVWYNYVSGFSRSPSICVDNKFAKGISGNNVYLTGSYSGVEGTIVLYNSGNEGSYPNNTANLTSITNYYSYLVKFNNDGYLSWCSKVGGSNNLINNSIVATNDGHVYLGGEFNTGTLNIYQGWTLGMDPNANIATSITNGGGVDTFDIFLIKYNRYGTVNNGAYRFGREVYLENNSSIPNGTEKSIVIINNNEYNGFRENICLMILQNDYPGYDSFRNIWFSEGVSLISYDGQWFIKSSSGDTIPKRSIIMWGGNQTNIPRGWRLCDGGSLNGVTTPDLRGRFVLGYNDVALVSEGTPYDVNGGSNARVGASLSVGTVDGEATHQLTIPEMPSHNHGITDPGHYHSYVNNVNDQNTDNAFATQTAADQVDLNQNTGSSTTGISINNTGGDQRHNNLPPFYVLAYIMKCF